MRLIEWIFCRVCMKEHPSHGVQVGDALVEGLGATRCSHCWTRLTEDDDHDGHPKKGRLCRACAIVRSRWVLSLTDKAVDQRRAAAVQDVRLGMQTAYARKTLGVRR